MRSATDPLRSEPPPPPAAHPRLLALPPVEVAIVSATALIVALLAFADRVLKREAAAVDDDADPDPDDEGVIRIHKFGTVDCPHCGRTTHCMSRGCPDTDSCAVKRRHLHRYCSDCGQQYVTKTAQ